MTAHKHLKQLIRARMEKTGERYADARRKLIGSAKAVPPQQSRVPFHFPGNVAATTALRALLTHAGVRAPHTGQPFTEAMLFGIAGGIGIGVFSFYYEKGDFASFYIAGRHQWHDDLSYLKGALAAFELAPSVRETSGKKTAAQELVKAAAGGRPCVAWVDMGSLPHRGMPEALQGSGYHVVSVYEVDEAKGTALIGDLSDEPLAISLEDLEAARARIAKQRFRLLWIEPKGAPPLDLGALVVDGLNRCVSGFLKPTLPQASNNARLEVLKTWAERLDSTKDKERWERVFRRGANLWRGLNFVYTFIESYGTGGGLCRPLFADFLDEAAAATSKPALGDLAARYREIGKSWSELADAALSDGVPLFRKAKDLRLRVAELRHAGGPAEEARETWKTLGELEREAAADFPLSEKRCADLLSDLKAQVLSLYQREAAALNDLQKVSGS